MRGAYDVSAVVQAFGLAALRDAAVRTSNRWSWREKAQKGLILKDFVAKWGIVAFVCPMRGNSVPE